MRIRGRLWRSVQGVTAAVLLVSCGADGAHARREVQSAASGVEQGRTAQVCPGPALPPSGCFTIETSVIGGRTLASYVVTRPDALLFDPVRRRIELRAMPASSAAAYCSAHPLADEGQGLPTLVSAASKVILFETDLGGGRTRHSADMEFTDMSTSDGYRLPRFGFIWNQERGSSQLALQFRPSIDANLAGIEGLTRDIVLTVDMLTGAANVPPMHDLPDALRRLLLAVAYRLPDLFGSATSVEIRPGHVNPLWTLPEVIAVASDFRAKAVSIAQPLFQPVLTLTCGESTCLEAPQLNRFRDYLVRETADYLYASRASTAAGLLANLRAWAAAQALTTYPGFVVGQRGQADFRPKYELQWFLVPLVQTWSLLRQDALVGVADKALIDGWIAQLVAYAVEPVGGPQNPDNPFNVGYLTRGLDMAWGVVTSDHQRFARGIERIYMGLHQMRSDGSFPREVARGACAMRYQATMLLNLLFMAELAAEQGYDAYGLSVNGRTLHSAVTFLLDAFDDPTRVLAYSGEDAANCSQAAEQPMEWSTIVDPMQGTTYAAWLEPYLARFPDHPNSVRLKHLLRGGLEPQRPINHPHSGGNTTCFSARSRPQLTLPRLECLFDWGRTHYPTALPVPVSESRLHDPYRYRDYGGGQRYLGVSYADGNLYYLDGSGLANLGAAADWMLQAGCR